MLPIVVWCATAHAGAVFLDRSSARLEVDLSEAVLQDGAPVDAVAITGPWRITQTVAGVRTWEAPLPARTRTLFFHRPPPGMSVRRESQFAEGGSIELTHRPDMPAQPDTWSFDTSSLQVRRPLRDGAPGAEYRMHFPRAVEREAGLRSPQGDPTGFVRRSIQVDDTTEHGLYLVPGAKILVPTEVPSDARLRFDAVWVPPEIADPAAYGDGVTFHVWVKSGATHATPTHLGTVRAGAKTRPHVDLDLGAFAGQQVDIQFTADIDGDDAFDAVLLSNPVVVTPDPSPSRVVVVFVDTLRADALSLYGYSRPTTPNLDAWAADARVFTSARSVAPWTLPTARTLLSGEAPEKWGQGPTLPTRLRDAGWSSAFIAGNIYLSSNFDMANDWGTHRCINWPQAEVQVARAQQWLAQQDDVPAFLVLHLMDMHLPYTEPAPFRDRFAGPTPPPFDGDVFHRNQINAWMPDIDEPARAWLRDRYDNNLAYIDAVLGPWLESLSPDTTVLFLSDHGEEFWDHGEFEHGHSLYEELLRVPLLLKGPGVGPGTVNAPVSLLDVAPTVLMAAGLSAELPGIALQSITSDDSAGSRALAFGRPLYGRRQWGVVEGTKKYTTTRSKEFVVDLASDPQESQNLLGRSEKAEEWRGALSQGLGRSVSLAWAFYPEPHRTGQTTRVRVEVPAGIRAAWVAEDPTDQSAADVVIDGTVAYLSWEGDQRGSREVYVVPHGNPREMLAQATVMVGVDDDVSTPMRIPENIPRMSTQNTVVARARANGRVVGLQLTVVPLPEEASVGISGFDEEVQEELKELGYVE